MIKLSDCTKIYNKGKSNEVEALTNVSLEIADGEAVAIMGISGSGKSTLLNVIGCLDVLTSGIYSLNDRDVSSLSPNGLAEIRNSEIGFVLQTSALLNNESVFENVKLPLIYGKKYKVKEFKKRVKQVLEYVGIGDLEKKKIRELSGGQIQRVGIARAIINDPNIILADEPTSALDSGTAQDILELFKTLNKQGKTVIVVTHDIKVAEKLDRIVRIADGKIADDSEI